MIVRSFSIPVGDFAVLSRLFSVHDARPSSCPGCGPAAFPPGKPLGIVGHGLYQRQMLGVALDGPLAVYVRRYLCRGCDKTISVLPDGLLPWLWYAGTVILLALVQSLLLARAAREIRERFGPSNSSARTCVSRTACLEVLP
ncbi:MAG: hypothetical protein R3F49_09695 [Planctomycetota bacterium]